MEKETFSNVKLLPIDRPGLIGVSLYLSIPHNSQVRDFLLAVESEDQPLGINTNESTLWTEPVNQVPPFEILRLVGSPTMAVTCSRVMPRKL